tara:strand:+ start:460 stop:570 length:111 start_codon:yes stop_codon:yes gene_type:complete
MIDTALPLQKNLATRLIGALPLPLINSLDMVYDQPR